MPIKDNQVLLREALATPTDQRGREIHPAIYTLVLGWAQNAITIPQAMRTLGMKNSTTFYILAARCLRWGFKNGRLTECERSEQEPTEGA